MNVKALAPWTISDNLTFGMHSMFIGTPVLYLFERYVFNDWDFLVSIGLLVFFDTIFGAWLAIKEKRFSATKGMSGFAKKLAYIAMSVMLIGIIDNAKIDGQESFFSDVIDSAALSILMAFEAVSAIKNLYKLNPPRSVKTPLEKILSKLSNWMDSW